MKPAPTTSLDRLRQWWDAFWFAPVPATSLAALRIATGVYAFYYVFTRHSMMLSLAGLDHAMFEPVGVARLLDGPLPVAAVEWLLMTTLIFNVAFVCGFAHRFLGPVFASLLLFVLCYRNSWGMIYHMHNLLVLHVLILGTTCAADAWSFDRLRHRVARRDRTCRSSKPHWRYGWPLRLVCAVTATTYFLAGIAKLLGELGWEWVSGEAIRSQIAVDTIRKELLGANPSELAAMIYGHAWVFALFGIGAMLIELGAPLALWEKRAGRVWAMIAFLFHWGVFFVMGITFRYHLSGIALLSFFLCGNAQVLRPSVGHPKSS